MKIVSLLLAGIAAVAAFVYIPISSDYAFWFVVAAFVLPAGTFSEQLIDRRTSANCATIIST